MLGVRPWAFFALCGGIALILATEATAVAQPFPTRPVRLIVPYPPAAVPTLSPA
jgi:tripartite-type tricarboxylate transporter receptor subunit TctC